MRESDQIVDTVSSDVLYFGLQDSVLCYEKTALFQHWFLIQIPIVRSVRIHKISRPNKR